MYLLFCLYLSRNSNVIEQASIFGKMNEFNRFKEGREGGFGEVVIKALIVVIILILLRFMRSWIIFGT